ncbi:MAG: MBL fold metallo-hydrolase [Gemmatimonadota bacterium]|nr:MBL fold metallo-hydrolase [Gemmatimonadota bacterium]
MLNTGNLEITPTELADILEGGENIQVLDVRAAHRLAAGTVEAPNFVNETGSVIMGLDDPTQVGIDPSARVAVVCGHGNASLTVAGFLAAKGFNALSLRGGVTAWMDMLRQRVVPAPAGFDRLVQFDRVGKGALGYLVVCGDEALAVDPSRAWQTWADAAEAAGARLVGVADTHVHADYISGAPALSATLGVPYYLHAADAVYPYDETPGMVEFTAIRDGDEISVGSSAITVCHTPGHTLGSVCFLLGEEAILTGDFLFVGSIGRPDLAGRTEAWTGDLWASLNAARATWPREAVVYPAHYGTDGERNPDLSVGRMFKELVGANPVLKITDEAEFRAYVNRGISAPPDAYRTIKAVNVGLAAVSSQEAQVLEAGKNECALG